MRQFNTAGPSVAADHYCVDPLTRINLDEILSLIDSKKYFVLHAPRQTGKTTCLLALMRYLNTQGRYRAVYANIETAQTARGDVSQGLRAVCSSVAGSIRRHLWAVGSGFQVANLGAVGSGGCRVRLPSCQLGGLSGQASKLPTWGLSGQGLSGQASKLPT